MRQLLYVVIVGLLMAGCGSSKKQLQKGNYDAAIQKAVKKLMRNPNSEDDIEILTRSFKLANAQNQERIKYLKMEGKAESWEEIAQSYQRLKWRQEMIRPVMPLELNGQTVHLDYVDYNNELIEAKHRAAEFFFAHGQKLMNNNNKDSYRQAWYEFSKVKDYWGDYENIDNLLMETRYLGMSRALVTIENMTVIRLSPEFKDDLLAINPQDLNSEWVEYYTRALDEEVQYDYQIKIILRTMDVSPDQIKETDRLEKRTVEDGFQYALDQNGNVMKDTTGNDIKIIKYKDLSCTVIETGMNKSSHIEGTVEIYQVNPIKLLRKDPIGADSHFEHYSARAIGDVEALSEESLRMVDTEPVPFPSDGEMIMRCSESMKMAIRGITQRNRRYIF